MSTLLLIVTLLTGSPSRADENLAPKAGVITKYHLVDLQPVSVSTYPTEKASVSRHYLHFRNADGNQFIVYEEDASSASGKEVSSLKSTMSNWGAVCTADLSCRAKAFCTGKCINMYYLVSNVATDPTANICSLVSYTCSKDREPAPAPPAPPANPAPQSK